MTDGPSIASVFAAVGQANQRAQFNIQFNNLQNTLIRRFNEDAEEAAETPFSVEREINILEDNLEDLTNGASVLREFGQGNVNNASQLRWLLGQVGELFGTFNSDDAVTAEEVSAFTARRDAIIQQVNNLTIFSHPEIVTPNVIQDLRDSANQLASVEPQAGALSDPANAAVSERLTAFRDRITNGVLILRNTVDVVNNLEKGITRQVTSVRTRLTSITRDERQRQETEIENLRARLGNQLRAISLTFEANSALADQLNVRLNPAIPDPGSVVSILT